MSNSGPGPSLWQELKRRNVYRVSIAYVIGSWLLLQVFDVVVSMAGAPDWVSKLVLGLLLLAFPFVVMFSWVYEITPDGIRKERDVERDKSIAPQTGRRLDTVIIGIFVASVAWIVAGFWFSGPQDAEPRQNTGEAPSQSIAVLPFVNMSADESSGYFSDGLSETLLHKLAQSSELRVAARTSSFRFRDQDVDVQEIAATLNVSTVLEGSVQRYGNAIRVTAQLIDAESGYHLWSGNFDRPFEDIFAIQDDIAQQVVSALQVTLLGQEASRLVLHPTEDVVAYESYILGAAALDEFSFSSLPRAMEYFRAAVERDPNYAMAWAAIGQTYVAMFDTGLIDEDELLASAPDAIQRALELDPGLGRAYALRAALLYVAGDKEAAESLLVRASELAPNDTYVMISYADFLNYEWRFEESLVYSARAVDRDPLSLESLRSRHTSFRGLEDHATAMQIAARMRETNPHSPNGYYLAGFNEADLGNVAQAILWFVQASDVDPDDPELPIQIGDYYLELYLFDDAERWYQRGIEIDPSHPMSASAPLVAAMFREDTERADSIARQLLTENIAERRGSRALALYSIARIGDRTGDYAEYLQWVQRFYPQMFEDPMSVQHDLTYAAARTAHAMLAMGDEERGQALMQRAVALQADLNERNGIYDGAVLVAAAAGNYDEAREYLTYLTEYPERLGAFDIAIKPAIFAEELYSGPEFRQIAANHQAAAEIQRQILLDANDGVYP